MVVALVTLALAVWAVGEALGATKEDEFLECMEGLWSEASMEYCCEQIGGSWVEIFDPATGAKTDTFCDHEAWGPAEEALEVDGGTDGEPVEPRAPHDELDVRVNGSDTAAPETTIDSAPKAKTRKSDSTFTFSSNESGVTFECSFDGDDFDACTSPHTVTNIAKGKHFFQVVAIDAAGNRDATPARVDYKIKARRR